MARLLRFSTILCALVAVGATLPTRAQTVTIGGVSFTNKGLVGVGRVDAGKKDKLGETFGSLSGLALDLRTWRRNSNGSYSATLYTQPDRGYTKAGATTNYRPRRHKFTLTFSPDNNGSSRQDQLDLSLSETTLLIESGGTALTSLDPTVAGSATRTGLPPLPQAYNLRLAIDPEGLALLPDGTFFVSDEYGPYLYRFAADGTLLGAVRPPEALIPKRNAQDSFSSDSPAAGQPSPSPSQPDAGRGNSQGLEGLSVSADGRTLYALMQSALRQDGGAGDNSQRRYTRLLAYDITNPAAPTLTGEWILPLPLYPQNGTQQVASVGDLVALGSNRFLVLTRDGNGRGADTTKSISRAVLIYDISAPATNIAGGAFDNPNTPAAPNGILAAAIVPATSAVLIDLTDESQLNDFGLNNNTNANSDTLAEKWESLALAPALDATAPDDYFLLVGNDNDFSTSGGFQQDGGSYSTSPNIDTMVLAYRVTLPGTLAAPSFITQPANRTVTVGQSTTFTAAASGTSPLTFQWSRNGVPIPGATSVSLTIPSAQAGDVGSYSVLITNANGSSTSSSATLTVNGANAPAFTAQPASQTIATGSTVVFSAAATNSPSYQWQRDGVTIAGATSRMLVISNATDPGSYTVVATNTSGVVTSTATLGVVSVAAADVGRLINLSILTNVTASDPSFTVGAVLGGPGTSGTKPLLVRAAGPSLTQFNVTGILPDPTMTLVNTSTNPGTTVAINDDWGDSAALSTAFAQVGAFAYVGPASKDAAIFQPDLAPANYTIQVSGVAGATGTVIAELYDATPAGMFAATTPRLVNVSVLKQIPSGSTLTAGFVIGGTTAKTVLVRTIGPRLALAPFSIPGTMADPKLDLFDLQTQTVIAANDNWGGDPQLTTVGTAVGAFAVTDPTSRDAILLVTLAPGNYTAQASGVNNTGGLAIVEIYEVP